MEGLYAVLAFLPGKRALKLPSLEPRLQAAHKPQRAAAVLAGSPHAAQRPRRVDAEAICQGGTQRGGCRAGQGRSPCGGQEAGVGCLVRLWTVSGLALAAPAGWQHSMAGAASGQRQPVHMLRGRLVVRSSLLLASPTPDHTASVRSAPAAPRRALLRPSPAPPLPHSAPPLLPLPSPPECRTTADWRRLSSRGRGASSSRLARSAKELMPDSWRTCKRAGGGRRARHGGAAQWAAPRWQQHAVRRGRRVVCCTPRTAPAWAAGRRPLATGKASGPMLATPRRASPSGAPLLALQPSCGGAAPRGGCAPRARPPAARQPPWRCPCRPAQWRTTAAGGRQGRAGWAAAERPLLVLPPLFSLTPTSPAPEPSLHTPSFDTSWQAQQGGSAKGRGAWQYSRRSTWQYRRRRSSGSAQYMPWSSITSCGRGRLPAPSSRRASRGGGSARTRTRMLPAQDVCVGGEGGVW